jgi:hypothetical protein
MLLWTKVLLFVVFLISWLVIFSLLVFFTSIHPRNIRTDLHPSDLGLQYEDVVFNSIDGLKLSAWFVPNNHSKSAIIVMHGYPADKANLLEVAKFLAKNFNVFLFDFRSFGDSEGKYTTIGYLERNDLLGAITYLEKKKNITKIGLYGFSLGGAVALTTPHKNVKAIVSDSSYTRLTHMVEQTYRVFLFFKYPLSYLTKLYSLLFLKIDIGNMNPVEDIKNIKVPLFIIHAGKDSQIPLKEAYLLHDANKKSQLLIVENADHGMTHAVNPQEYEHKVMMFFKDNLK